MYDIVPYDDKYENRWDDFITLESINGTFLHSRKFLSYHPKERYQDCSLIVTKKNKIVALIPACLVNNEGKNIFYSHAGSTYGGLVLSNKEYKASYIIEMIDCFESYLIKLKFDEVILKLTPDLFSSQNSDLLQYILFFKKYQMYNEISTYIDLKSYNSNILKDFSSGQKENLRNALKNNLEFKTLSSEDELGDFYSVLCDNLLKYNTKPVHSLSELKDFMYYRLKDIVRFYGIYSNNEMIAGGMIFIINNVVHTQYLAAKQKFVHMSPMTFLYYKLIETAKAGNYDKLSWGISTEQHGSILNLNLLSFKESFGSKYSLNRTYRKELEASN